jgi:SOS-response transcriptional repressor LexA
MTGSRASKKQQELLQFVDGFIKGHGFGPSYRELMRALGYKSVSTVAAHIDQLIVKGYLEKTDNSARSLAVVGLRSEAEKPKKTDENETVRRVIQAKIDELGEQSGSEKTVQALRTALDALIS